MVDLGKVLVTGADGFIGSHLVEALVAQGADVRAFSWYDPEAVRLARQVAPGVLERRARPGDIRDRPDVTRLCGAVRSSSTSPR